MKLEGRPAPLKYSPGYSPTPLQKTLSFKYPKMDMLLPKPAPKTSYLHVPIFPGKHGNERKTKDDQTANPQQDRTHDPVQGHHTRSFIYAGFTALSALEALELCGQVVHG